jgi:hypothetical protein
MARFTSLLELATELTVGDNVAWISAHSIEGAGETTAPNTITKIEQLSECIQVHGEGIQGGEYYFKAYQDGATEAFHVVGDSDQYKGSVVMARLTDSKDRVPVKRVYDDIRNEQKENADD